MDDKDIEMTHIIGDIEDELCYCGFSAVCACLLYWDKTNTITFISLRMKISNRSARC